MTWHPDFDDCTILTPEGRLLGWCDASMDVPKFQDDASPREQGLALVAWATASERGTLVVDVGPETLEDRIFRRIRGIALKSTRGETA